MKTISKFIKHLAKFFLEWELFQMKVLEKIKIHILCPITFFPKIVPFKRKYQKCGGAREATNDVTIWCIRVACWIMKATRMHTPTHPGTRPCTHAHSLTHTKQICNTYFFSTATIVTRTRLNVAWYVHCLSCKVTEHNAMSRTAYMFTKFWDTTWVYRTVFVLPSSYSLSQFTALCACT
jgi:hypothetical protein